MKKSSLLLLLVAGLCACESSEKGRDKHSHVQSIGQPSEVVLILDNAVLNSDLKDSLEDMLTVNVPGLNQGEDFFRMSRIPTSMDKGEFKRMHSRVLVKVDNTVKQPTVGIATDIMAAPQVQVQISTPNVNALRGYVSSHGDYIRQLVLDNQLSIQASFLAKHHSAELYKDLKEVLGYTVEAPEEIKFTKKGKDFVWGSSRTAEKQLNMVFYTRPYFGPNIADVRELVMLRDSVMMENIPGSQPDQWMETVWEGENPVVTAKERELDGRMITEMRGLWQMRNGAMGGPFVSICFVDSAAQKLVVGEGFVFSPSTSKRDLVRRLEASLRTLKKHGKSN